mgnify:CR=1 FL=1
MNKIFLFTRGTIKAATILNIKLVKLKINEDKDLVSESDLVNKFSKIIDAYISTVFIPTIY